MIKKLRIKELETCPNCGESADEDARLYRCPTCGTEGFECCFPAGNNTECLDCETREIDDSFEYFHEE